VIGKVPETPVSGEENHPGTLRLFMKRSGTSGFIVRKSFTKRNDAIVMLVTLGGMALVTEYGNVIYDAHQ
jgi:hypothetical protein